MDAPNLHDFRAFIKTRLGQAVAGSELSSHWLDNLPSKQSSHWLDNPNPQNLLPH